MLIASKRSVLFFLGILFAVTAMADETNQLDRALNAIIQSLPAGWTIAEKKSGQIPWGHHWNQNYKGPTGLLVIAKGIRPVNGEFCDTNDETWHTIHVATESLQIWLMPSNYSDSFLSKFTIDRPVQPTVVISDGAVKVYATPSHLLLSEKDFWDTMDKFNGIRWLTLRSLGLIGGLT